LDDLINAHVLYEEAQQMKYEYQRRSVTTLNTRKAVLSTLAVSYQWTLSANICLPACLPVFPNAPHQTESNLKQKNAELTH
jgi:hypothetical protein